MFYKFHGYLPDSFSLSMRLLLFSTPFFPPKAILTEIVLTIAGQLYMVLDFSNHNFEHLWTFEIFTFEVVEICLSFWIIKQSLLYSFTLLLPRSATFKGARTTHRACAQCAQCQCGSRSLNICRSSILRPPSFSVSVS